MTVDQFTNPSINIETLVLVAVWKQPSIFQGCFKITEYNGQNKQYLFFRCECSDVSKTDLLKREFEPHDYQFTYLYREAASLENVDHLDADAVYLLKYGLNETLKKMITSRKQTIICMDEMALQSITKRVQPIFSQASWIHEDNNVGFAVSIDFKPTESFGQAAALALLFKSD